MADIASRLKSVQDGIEQLVEFAAPAQADAARRQAEVLKAELDTAIAETDEMSPPSEATVPLPHGPRQEEIRCPICSLRSFTYQQGTLRRSDETSTGREALYHCRSCGHEAWHEAE